jgi:hypothetical protein
MRDKPIFSSDRMLHKDYYRKGSTGGKNLWSLSLQGLDARTNWLALNRQSWSNFDFDFDLAVQLRIQTRRLQS